MKPDYFVQPRNEMISFLPERYSKVLEVGCGAGAFLAKLSTGSERWGIEPDARSAQSAARTVDRVLEGTFENCLERLPKRYFDLVICNDVIEHMPDHEVFLNQVKQVMQPGAVLVGSVPNIRQFFVLWDLLVWRDFRYRPSGILDRTHLRFFTEKSLRRSLEQQGYTIERLSAINRIKFRLSLKRLVLVILTVVTLGAFLDTWFDQFAFRARVA